MKMKLGGLALAWFAVLLTACSTNISRTELNPGPTESIIIFGVKPENARLSLYPGEVIEGKFKQNWFLDTQAKVHDTPQDGYVTAKVKAGQALGMTTVQMSIGGGLWGPIFSFCGNPKLLVFEVPAGKVAYAADIEFVQLGNALRPRFSRDLDAARQHFKQNHPNITDEVVPLDLQFIPVSGCSGPAP